MEKPMFSIVMPVYNAAGYIDKTIKSVINQTFGDWQLILIDDCSSDNSLEICNSYADNKRIEVIHLEENRGAANARNVGIEAAKGMYTTFMDADDYIDNDTLAKVFAVVNAFPAKLTVAGAFEEYYNAQGNIVDTNAIMPIPDGDRKAVDYDDGSHTGDSLKVLQLKEKKLVRKYIIELEKRTLYGYLWNKYYETGYLKKLGLKLEAMPLLEDAKFNIMYAMDIDTMNLVNIAAYHYCKRTQGSLTSKFVKDYFEIHQNHVNMLFSQQITWGNADSDTRRALGDIYGRYIISALQRNCDPRSEMKHHDRKEWFEQVVNDNLFEQLIDFAQGNGLLDGILTGIVKSRQAWLNLAAGRVIYIVKTKFPSVFAKARKQR